MYFICESMEKGKVLFIYLSFPLGEEPNFFGWGKIFVYKKKKVRFLGRKTWSMPELVV